MRSRPMKLYDENGFLNIHGILSESLPFNLIVGGRGTGKTYGTLCECLDSERKFMLLRRTQSQVDIINKPEFSPFKRVNLDRNIEIVTSAITKYNSGFYVGEEVDGKITAVGAPKGYTAALSTFSNVRGFDASDVDLLVFDEFIPERHERPIKNEFEALMNCYETVNRNRELKGEKPVQMLCLANANDLGNPLFIGLNLVKRAMSMLEKGVENWKDPKRGINLYMLQKSPISEAKAETALYRLTEGTAFAEMSLENKFSGDAVGKIGSKPLKEYTPLVVVGEICLYRHKADGTYYITSHISGSPPIYRSTGSDIQRFRYNYGWIWQAYIQNKIIFEDYTFEILLQKLFKS